MNILSSISPADFENFVKLLNLLIKDKPTDNIKIRNSEIYQLSNNCVIIVDLKPIFGTDNLVTLDIINPKKYVSLFSNFKGNNYITINDDIENVRYVISNGGLSLYLPKNNENIFNQIELVDFTDSVGVTQRKFDKELRKIIKALSKDEDFIEYMIIDNLFKAIHIPKTAKYIFEEFQSDVNLRNMDVNNSDILLRSSNFLPIETEEYIFTIWKLKNGNYATITDCVVGGNINVKIIEQVDITTNSNILF